MSRSESFFEGGSRRRFLQTAGTILGTGGLTLPALGARLAEKKRLRVAAIFTVFHYRSHAHVLLENFLEPYLFRGKLTDPGVDVVSFYADQTAKKDMTQDVARRHKVRVFKTIREALCLGGKELAV